MKDRKVGERFICNNVQLTAVEMPSCLGCVFQSIKYIGSGRVQLQCKNDNRECTGPCSTLYRLDGKSIIFVEVGI